MHEEHHVDNGMVIGAILLCLNDHQYLKKQDLPKILKNINILDSKKGSSISFNPNFIEEETNFYVANKIYSYSNDGWILMDRKKANEYCNSFIDNNLQLSIKKTSNLEIEI